MIFLQRRLGVGGEDLASKAQILSYYEVSGNSYYEVSDSSLLVSLLNKQREKMTLSLTSFQATLGHHVVMIQDVMISLLAIVCGPHCQS